MDVHSRRGARASRLVCSGAGVVLSALLPATLPGQVTGSVGIGASGVRQPGGPSWNSESVSPALTLASRHAAGTVSGALTALPLGAWALQGGGDIWLVSDPLGGRMRLGAELSGSHQVRAGESGSAVHGIGEVVWDGGTWGVAGGAGVSAGFVPGLADVTALHGRLRAWRRSGAAVFTASVEPVSWAGSWYDDASAAVGFTRGGFSASAAVTRRGGPAALPSTGGGVSASVAVLPGVALEAAAGRSLRDPFQALPNVSYVALGVRLSRTLSRSPAAVAPAGAGAARLQPLELARRQDDGGVAVRFGMSGARTVAIAGDWDGWRVHELSEVPGARGVFAGTIAVPRGRWHFTLLVDGTDWVVPQGIAAVPDSGDGGGLVSLLVVR